MKASGVQGTCLQRVQTEHKGQERRGRGGGLWWPECQARIQETWAPLPAPATNSLGVLEQDDPEGRVGGAGRVPRPCLEEELYSVAHAFRRSGAVFNQDNFVLKSHLGAFKGLGYMSSSRGSELRCPGDMLEKREPLIPKRPVLCLVWKANRQGSLLED